MDYGIHWFRRDLRVAGNLALKSQFKKFDGRVVGIFCFDKEFLSRPDFSAHRFLIFLETLVALKEELVELGSDLLVLDIGPHKAFREVLSQLEKVGMPPGEVSWCRDYEPFAIQRDQKIKELLESRSIDYETFRDHLLVEPHELEKTLGQGYQVYTPFSKKWLKLMQTETVKKRLKAQNAGIHYLESRLKGDVKKVFKLNWKDVFSQGKIPKDHLEDYCSRLRKEVTLPIPEAGSLAAYKKLKEFSKRVNRYGDKRDFPFAPGTSQLSVYLKNGSMTVPQIIQVLGLKPYEKKQTGKDIYLSELIWREFYYHILARHPRVEKEAFLEKYKDLKWENSKKYFKAWKEGRTGFPIVDAGMRQLKTTGWMHNRVRMIVASFLTKDLLIDWKWGEKYFMETLLDGDLAPNNGGWQWAASTGCDPQPYFRIFNPWSQSKKFDLEGEYIKTFVPELKDFSSKELHEPILGHAIYPEPIVDHSVQREKALALYKSV